MENFICPTIKNNRDLEVVLKEIMRSVHIKSNLVNLIYFGI